MFTANLKKASYLLLVTFALAFSSTHIVGQAGTSRGSDQGPRRPMAPESTRATLSSPRDVPFDSPEEPVDCEVANFFLDDAVRRTQKTATSYFIVIGRLGNGEYSRQRTLSRLRSVESHLRQWPDLRFVTAEGARVKGHGRVELYVNGSLLYILPIRKNSNLDLRSCKFF